MAMIAGKVLARTGMAGAIADALETTFGKGFDPKKSEKALEAIATAIVIYIQTNAEVDLSGSDPASVD